MRSYPLVIGPKEGEVLADLMARAAASPTPYAIMKALAEAHAGGQRDLGDLNRALTVELPVDYTITLTHEEHQPGVMCRHVSVGLRTLQSRGPTPEAVNMVLAALGFTARCGVVECVVGLEILADGTFAVNVVEPLSGNLDDLRRGKTLHAERVGHARIGARRTDGHHRPRGGMSA